MLISKRVAWFLIAFGVWSWVIWPTFHERMTTRLGETSCRSGTHLDWLAEARHTAHNTADATHERQNLIYADTRPETHQPVQTESISRQTDA